jgi:hypothetical protein
MLSGAKKLFFEYFEMRFGIINDYTKIWVTTPPVKYILTVVNPGASSMPNSAPTNL